MGSGPAAVAAALGRRGVDRQPVRLAAGAGLGAAAAGGRGPEVAAELGGALSLGERHPGAAAGGRSAGGGLRWGCRRPGPEGGSEQPGCADRPPGAVGDHGALSPLGGGSVLGRALAVGLGRRELRGRLDAVPLVGGSGRFARAAGPELGRQIDAQLGGAARHCHGGGGQPVRLEIGRRWHPRRRRAQGLGVPDDLDHGGRAGALGSPAGPSSGARGERPRGCARCEPGPRRWVGAAARW